MLEKEYGVHPVILDELRTPTLHPLFESYGSYLFAVMHFPHLNDAQQRMETVEIDFIITKHAIITIRYRSFPDFDEVFRDMQSEDMHEEVMPGHVFHRIIKALIKKTAPEITHIRQAVDAAEDAMLDYIDDRNIERLALVKRLVLDFLRALRPQKALWEEDVPEAGLAFWGDSMKPYVSDLSASYNRILYLAENYLSTIDSIYLTSSVLLDNKRSNVIKILTLFTAIILPLSLITSIYGMNITHLPGSGNPHIFWWFAGGMTVVAISMYGFFRYSKWI